MERYWVATKNLRYERIKHWDLSDIAEQVEVVSAHQHDIVLADAQATVEALQAQLKTARYDAVRAFVRGEDKMCFVCGAKEPCELKDDPSSPCTFDPTPMELKQQVEALQANRCETCGAKVKDYVGGCPGCSAPQCCPMCCRVEALQRERDHAKKMAAVQKEVADNQTWHVRELTAALDAERELSAAWAEKARQYELELDGDPQNFHGQGRTIGVREQLLRLQALVRAFIEAWDHDGEPNAVAYEGAVERARATLDAMTPAKEEMGCQICKGAKGVHGNEQIINGIVVCDYCHVAYIREERGDGE